MDIILLIFLSMRIGRLAELKGQHVIKWRINLVIAWIIGEFVGATIGIKLFGKDNMFSWLILGLACAITTYFIIKSYLDKMPDKLHDDINNIGQ